MTPRRPAAWWELLLPAGWWLLAAELVLAPVRLYARLGIRWPWNVVPLLRLATALSRIGLRVWRHRNSR